VKLAEPESDAMNIETGIGIRNKSDPPLQESQEWVIPLVFFVFGGVEDELQLDLDV
jgi:hypothetical protein